MCVGFLFLWKLLLQLAAATALWLRFLLLAAGAVRRCRCCFSTYLPLRCWLAACEVSLVIVVFSSCMFNVLYLIWESAGFVSIEEQQAAVCWPVRFFRDMMMLVPDPPVYLLLPLCLWAALVQGAMFCTRVGSRSCFVYSSIHREHSNEKQVLVARFCGTLLLAPTVTAAAVGCLGPASNAL